MKSAEIRSDAVSLGHEMLENPIQHSTTKIPNSPEKVSLFNSPIFDAKIFPLFNKYKATQLEDALKSREMVGDESDILEINIPVIGSEFAPVEIQIDPYDNGYRGDLNDRSRESMLEFKVLDDSRDEDVGSTELLTTYSPATLEKLDNLTLSSMQNQTTFEVLKESTTRANFWTDLKKEQKEAEGLMQAINKVVIIPQEANIDQETAKVFSLLAEKVAQKKNTSELEETAENLKQEEILEREIFGSSSDIIKKYVKITDPEKSEDEKLIQDEKSVENLEKIEWVEESQKDLESLEQKVIKFIDNLKIDTPQSNNPQFPIFEPTPYNTYTTPNEYLSTPQPHERVYRHQSHNQQSGSIKELADELDKLIQKKMKEYAETEIENQIWLKNLEMNALNFRPKLAVTTMPEEPIKLVSTKKVFIANKNPHEILSSVFKKIKPSQVNPGKNNQPSYKTLTDDQYNGSVEASNESQEKVAICKFGDIQKSNCVKRAASPNEDLLPKLRPNQRILADWANQYKVPYAIKRRQESSMERIDRVNTNLDRMMQFVSVVS